MSLEDIKKRWEEFRPTAHHEIGALIRIAEAAKVYVHITEREKWEALENLKKALAELEGE